MCPLCLIGLVLLLIVFIPTIAVAQMPMPAPQPRAGQQQSQMQMDMPDMPDMKMPANPSSTLLMQESSGTSTQPLGWAMPMVTTRTGAWQL